MTEPTASIIILAHNQLVLTRTCVDSVRLSTPEPHEIILVDNASTEPGWKAWTDREKKRGLRVLRQAANLGYAAGNNAGVRASAGRYIVLLNNDTVVTEGWLGRLIAAAESSPDVGAVGPLTNRIWGCQSVLGDGHYTAPSEFGRFVPQEQAAMGLSLWARFIARSDAGRTLEIDGNRDRLTGFCVLIKRSVLDRIGLLDEGYGRGNFEDDDLMLRLRLAGYRQLVALDAWVHHEGSVTHRALGIDHAALLRENRERFVRKWQGLTPLYILEAAGA